MHIKKQYTFKRMGARGLFLGPEKTSSSSKISSKAAPQEKSDRFSLITRIRTDATNMRASSDSISWRGASIDEASVVSVLGTTNSTNTKNTSTKHQCLFAACVPAKECDSEEVK